MGAGFSSLYCEIHYFEVRYIEVRYTEVRVYMNLIFQGLNSKERREPKSDRS